MSSPDQEGPPEPGTNAAANDDSASPISEDLSEDSSTCSSDTETHSDKTPKSTRRKIAAKMLHLCKEITIMVLIAVTYATLTNENLPKVSKSPAAYPFFPEGSVVTDWYRGQITEAIEHARASDIAFVMFYAPWDAESQAARGEFEKTARFMYRQVSFTAINCWQPGSECRRQYSKVYKWPVLIAYPTHGRGIQYNGPLEANHMVKFLQNVCQPLVLSEKINEIIAKHDAVVLGNINLSPGSFEYAVFYLTALRFLERDPFRDVRFAVMPQNGVARIHMFLWNGTLSYEDSWNTDMISSWILKNLIQVTGWVSPTGTKSHSISNNIQPGPALVLFTPKNPLLEQIDYYDLLKEVAFEYVNCANDTVLTLKQKLVRLERMKNRVNHRDFRVKCLGDIPSNYQPKNINIVPTVVSNKPKAWINSSMTVQLCKKQPPSCHFTPEQESICDNHDNLSSNPKISMMSQLMPNDRRSAENLKKLDQKNQCRNFLTSEKYLHAIFDKDLQNDIKFDISGLACNKNESLTLVAMDALRYHHFAERLGVDVLEMKDKTAAVIIDEKSETFYVMEKPLTSSNLRVFIKNFTDRNLGRTLTSNISNNVKKTHVYQQQNCADHHKSEICVEELTSSGFLPAILQQNKAVLVFYYSKQCAFCSGYSSRFLSVALILKNVSEIAFTRIDGDLQPLPWEYTMESYPTIIFFPTEKKAESRAFPRNVPVTVPNLIGFILTNLEPVLKLKAMWAICDQTKFEDEKCKCVTSVRTETLSIIDRTLKQWRMVDARKRARIVYKLQVLKNLHLLFAHSPGEVSKINNFLSKLQGISNKNVNESLALNNVIRDEL